MLGYCDAAKGREESISSLKDVPALTGLHRTRRRRTAKLTPNMNIADEIMELEPSKRGGTLRTFGCWFGRPMDNYHQVVAATFDGEILRIAFDEGETLEVWNPSNLVIDGVVIKIPKATKVKWSWFYYGKTKEPENLLHYEYVVQGNSVSSSTNSPWPNEPSIDEAAVELC